MLSVLIDRIRIKCYSILMKNRTIIYSILVIVLLVQLRLIPHPPNFTPILAASIFSGFYFRHFFVGLFIIIFSMFLGDLYLGFHSTMFFTYISLAVAVILGFLIKNLKFSGIIFSGLVSSFSFFIITNFGAWITLDMYEKSLAGLMNSYILAIPFFQNTLISTFLYLFLFKIFFEFIVNKKKILKV